MRGIRPRFGLVLCAGLLLVAASCHAETEGRPAEDDHAATGTVRILMVGDSWADLMAQWESLRTVFAENGITDVRERGVRTGVGGTTAGQWAHPISLNLIAAELELHPAIDIIHLSLGANDILWGEDKGGWVADMTPEEEAAHFDDVVARIEAVIRRCQKERPGVRIVLSGYDYLNFEGTMHGEFCPGVWSNMHSPATRRLNDAFIALESRKQALARTIPGVTYVGHFGLMQNKYGFPEAGIAPGQLAPPGDPGRPSPLAAMNGGTDCLHLSPEGYVVLARNLYEKAYRGLLRPPDGTGVQLK